jgi:hypothetical protein
MAAGVLLRRYRPRLLKFTSSRPRVEKLPNEMDERMLPVNRLSRDQIFLPHRQLHIPSFFRFLISRFPALHSFRYLLRIHQLLVFLIKDEVLAAHHRSPHHAPRPAEYDQKRSFQQRANVGTGIPILAAQESLRPAPLRANSKRFSELPVSRLFPARPSLAQSPSQSTWN